MFSLEETGDARDTFHARINRYGGFDSGDTVPPAGLAGGGGLSGQQRVINFNHRFFYLNALCALHAWLMRLARQENGKHTGLQHYLLLVGNG